MIERFQFQIRLQQDKNNSILLPSSSKSEGVSSISIRFKTESQPYNKIYEKWDKTQSNIEKNLIDKYVTLIEEMYHKKKQPISILDAGCGYGKQAFTIKTKLEQKGVKIAKFYGYDVSYELIQLANQKYKLETNLKFIKKNLDTEFDDVEQFDVIVSFLALHWVNDIKSVCESLARALKPGGLFLAQIGLENQGLYEARAEFIKNSEWMTSFTPHTRNISPIYSEPQIYLLELRKYFTTIFDQLRLSACQLNHKQSVEFLGNWIPQVRSLLTGIQDQPRRKAIIRAYTSDLVDSISLGLNKDMEKKEDGSIIYNIRTILYEGVKQ